MLREALAKYYARFYPQGPYVDADENVTVVLGATEGFAVRVVQCNPSHCVLASPKRQGGVFRTPHCTTPTGHCITHAAPHHFGSTPRSPHHVHHTTHCTTTCTHTNTHNQSLPVLSCHVQLTRCFSLRGTTNSHDALRGATNSSMRFVSGVPPSIVRARRQGRVLPAVPRALPKPVHSVGSVAHGSDVSAAHS